MEEPTKKSEPAPGADPAAAADIPPRRRPGRVRLTSVAGTGAALLLGLCFFLEWVRVDPALGSRFRTGIDEAIAERAAEVGEGAQPADETLSAVEEDFRTLAETLAEEGALTGMDLIYWVRTAGSFGRSIDSEQARAQDAKIQRALAVARVLLYALLSVAFLLAAYFLFHRFRRVTAPILILCVLIGATAVVLAGGLNYAHLLVQDALGADAEGVSAGPGLIALLVGGAGLVLAGVFGVSARNFYRVYIGAGIWGAALVLLGRRYFQTGSFP